MNRNLRNLLICVLAIILLSCFASRVERNFGTVDVQQIRIVHPQTGQILVGKLYRPRDASADDPRPAVLALHGYQNDKDTQGAFAIELSRRGFVVLALDQIGHGDTTIDLSAAGNDPTRGGDAAYKYLKTLPFVDPENMGIMGHSMGSMTTYATAGLNPDHKALNPQCGATPDPSYHNVLLSQALWEEFLGFRENEGRVEGLTTHPNRLKGFLREDVVEWDTTYGSFADGTARRMALIRTVHPGVTHSHHAVTEAVEWMRQALMQDAEPANWIPADRHIYMWKEWATLAALLIAIFSLVPLTNLLFEIPWFAEVVQPMPEGYVAQKKQWWLLAAINVVIGTLTYSWATFTAGQIRPKFIHLPQGWAVAFWFMICSLIFVVLFTIWYRTTAKKQGVTMYHMGVSFDESGFRLNWRILGKTLLVGAIGFAFLYTLVSFTQWAFGMEFRFLWGFMRQFGDTERFWQFLLLLLPIFAFMLLNGGMFLFGQARQPEYGTPCKTLVIWWLKNSFALVFCLVIVWAVQYIPYFTGSPPGFEVLGISAYSAMWPLMTMIYIPEFMVLLLLATWYFRRTGRVYLGSLMAASLAAWFTAAGSVFM